MKAKYSTHYVFVAMVNNRPQYVESIIDLSDKTLIAKVKVITKGGKEISRDQFIKKENLVTVEDYYKTLSKQSKK